MADKRHFTIVLDNKEQGLFTGKNPSSVAKKAVSKLSKGKKVIFELREITQGSKKKVYGPYAGVKKKLDKPVTLGDRVYKYESIVKKIDGAKSSKGGYIGNVSSHSTVMLELKTDDGKRITIEKTRKGVGAKISSKLGKLFGKRQNHNKEESGYKLFINAVEQEVIPIYDEKHLSLSNNEINELKQHDFARLDRFIEFLNEVLSENELAQLKGKVTSEAASHHEWEHLRDALGSRRNSTSSKRSNSTDSTITTAPYINVESNNANSANILRYVQHLENLKKLEDKISELYKRESLINKNKAYAKERRLMDLQSKLEFAAQESRPNYKLYDLVNSYVDGYAYEDITTELFQLKNKSGLNSDVKGILRFVYDDMKNKDGKNLGVDYFIERLDLIEKAKEGNLPNSTYQKWNRLRKNVVVKGRNSEVAAITEAEAPAPVGYKKRKYYFLPNISYRPKNNGSQGAYKNENKKLIKYIRNLENLKNKFQSLPEKTNEERKRKDYVYDVLIDLDAKKDNYQEHDLVDILDIYIDGSLVEKIRKDIINLGNKNVSSNNKYVLGHYWKMLKKPSNTNKMTPRDFLEVVTAIDEIKQSQRGGFGNALHTIDLHVNGKDFKITKKSSSMLGKLALQKEAHYELIVSQGTYTKSYFNNGTLKQVVQVIYEELPHHVCDFIDQLAKKAREDSSWNHLLESLYCDRNKNRAILNYESKKRNEENLLNRISKFGNWLKSNKKRQEIFSALDERKKYELYGRPNGDLDYERLKFDIESQADFEKWLERNSNRKEIFNSLSNNKLNTFTKKNGSFDYDKLRILIQVKSNEQKNKGFFNKYF